MVRNRVRGVSVLSGIVLGVCAIVALVMALLLYFEVMSLVVASKVLYATFMSMLFVFSFASAKIIGARGFFIGLVIAAGIIFLTLLYRVIGVETGLGVQFLLRSGIVALVSIIGAVVGVNTVKR